MPDAGIWVWFWALAGGLVLLVLSPVCLFRRGKTQSTWLRQSWVIAVCVLAAVCCWDALEQTADSCPLPLRYLISAVGLIGLVQLVLYAARCKLWAPTAGALLLAGLLATGHAGSRFLAAASNEDADLTLVGIEQSLSDDDVFAVEGCTALTDAGRPIPLYGVKPHGDLLAFEKSTLQDYYGRVIFMARADLHANCHGWAYTAGQYWVRCADVPAILEDNGYQVVETPQPGDLIIYRDDDGKIVHTGQVKATGARYVLVESKWGPLGVYLHAPDDQCYGRSYRYYRSQREGHLLDFVLATTGDAETGPYHFPANCESE